MTNIIDPPPGFNTDEVMVKLYQGRIHGIEYEFYSNTEWLTLSPDDSFRRHIYYRKKPKTMEDRANDYASEQTKSCGIQKMIYGAYLEGAKEGAKTL